MEMIATEIVQSLDSFRAFFLRVTLRLQFLRQLYKRSHDRLAAGMLISTLFYLPIAVLRPELLLAFGPLVLGYPHLISSFRFTSKGKRFHLFFFATLIAIALHLFHTDYPFGVWQMIVATAVFILLHPKKIIPAILICAVSVKAAWMEPIMYVGGMLIAHNFVSFTYWIRSAATKQRRTTAILSTILFTLIHVIVLMGLLDSWISISHGENKTSWLLSSWTTDAIVGHRMLVLYAFGLSIHYFVWLRAIPESLSKFEHPHSVRLILINLKENLGKNTRMMTLVLSASLMILWAISMPLGAQIYFELALLHGALEIIFLLEKKT